jgi:hypothetical protein
MDTWTHEKMLSIKTNASMESISSSIMLKWMCFVWIFWGDFSLIALLMWYREDDLFTSPDSCKNFSRIIGQLQFSPFENYIMFKNIFPNSKIVRILMTRTRLFLLFILPRTILRTVTHTKQWCYPPGQTNQSANRIDRVPVIRRRFSCDVVIWANKSDRYQAFIKTTELFNFFASEMEMI